jgi:serine/threonine-protein kinase
LAATYSSLVGVAVGGKYEIRRVLGAGGMGVVCEAVHVDLGKRVAIKLIDKSMKESELIVARFKREARATGQIESEHIVDVFDVGADQRVGLYMVMEYLTGEDLQERLERDKTIDARTAVMIGHQVARGLARAHAAGVVHRDLKPANVFLTQRDNGQLLVKLLDFGVSKIIADVPGEARITGQGTPIGTPLYMSPEQAEAKDDVDGRADIWSLGAVLYEALAGKSAFVDKGSYHNTIIGILTTRPKPLFEVAPTVPKALCTVVDAMLVHDRDVRIADAGAVTQRLLDVFPSVLPDGTGHHTAVIVPHADTIADGTSDTEVFTSAQVPVGARISRPPLTPPKPVDSSLTITGNEIPSLFPPPPSVPGGSSRPKTLPLPPVSSSTGPVLPSTNSSAKLESIRLSTPSEIKPLRPSVEKEPSKRSPLLITSLMLGVVGIAIGAYLAGSRAQSNPPPVVASPTQKPSPSPVFTELKPPPTIAPPTLDPPATTMTVETGISNGAPPPSASNGRFRPIHRLKIKPGAKPVEPAPEAPTPAPAPEPEPSGNPSLL